MLDVIAHGMPLEPLCQSCLLMTYTIADLPQISSPLFIVSPRSLEFAHGIASVPVLFPDDMRSALLLRFDILDAPRVYKMVVMLAAQLFLFV